MIVRVQKVRFRGGTTLTQHIVKMRLRANETECRMQASHRLYSRVSSMTLSWRSGRKSQAYKQCAWVGGRQRPTWWQLKQRAAAHYPLPTTTLQQAEIA